MSAITVRNLTKRYGSVTALENVDLTVPDGEVFGFLGPNGAGKSTLINILLNFARPTDGTATVFGHDCQTDSVAVRTRTGILPERYSLFDHLTGRQHIEYAIAAKGADDQPGEILSRVGLQGSGDQPATGYSTGMAHRLVLGMALVGSPDLLILDEPTSGLDPNGIKRIREIIRAERDRGATVFFSSHILEQVEAVCDRIGILYHGSIITTGTIQEIRDSVGAETRLSITVDRLDSATVDTVAALDAVEEVTTDDDHDQLSVVCADDAKFAVLSALHEADVEIRNFETEGVSLEAMFAAFTEGAHR